MRSASFWRGKAAGMRECGHWVAADECMVMARKARKIENKRLDEAIRKEAEKKAAMDEEKAAAEAEAFLAKEEEREADWRLAMVLERDREADARVLEEKADAEERDAKSGL